jgi:beta-N-acetylhexosaminidase
MNDIRALAAGVICTGFDGTTIDEALEQEMRSLPLAGLILFGRNTETLEQTRALTDRIRAIYANPIIAIDQEGGRVMRLRKGVEEFPAMLAVAAANDDALARRAGRQLAFDLRRAGVNVDYAPVLDLALFRMNTVIGARSFGDDPQRVARFAGEVAEGLSEQGIVATYKHFPGHGSTAVDSHLDLPVIDLDEQTMRARDLAPFVRLLPGAQAVMTAHIVVRALDPENPATTSRRILTDLLRTEIGFKGVCFTDCMQMDAIAKGMGSAAGAARAIAAGADCVLISHSFEVARRSIDAIVSAVESGTVPLTRLQEAYERVSALRAALHPPLALDAKPPHAGIGREIGRRAVTLLRGDPHARADESIVLTFEGATTEGVQGFHSEHAQLGGDLGLQQLRLSLDPEAPDARAAITRLRETGKRPIVLMRRAHVYRKQRDAVDAVLDAFPDALVVSTREPFDGFELPKARNVICTYGDDAPSIQGLSDVIFGGAAAEGRFPISDAVAYA